ncbi:arginine exporter protein ArgO [Mesorhizobium sp. YL-MeA3-2017]|nr:arginine exporter protein ArgO [Mesorhizobium sp. YL-MeA3-2017]
MIAGVSGVGAFLQIMPSIRTVMQAAGIAFVLWCAVKALRSAGSASRPK